MVKKLGPYIASHRKALVAYAGAVLTVAVAVAPASKWVAVAVAVAAALGVHGVPNRPAAVTPVPVPPAVPGKTG